MSREEAFPIVQKHQDKRPCTAAHGQEDDKLIRDKLEWHTMRPRRFTGKEETSV